MVIDGAVPYSFFWQLPQSLQPPICAAVLVLVEFALGCTRQSAENDLCGLAYPEDLAPNSGVGYSPNALTALSLNTFACRT